MILFHSLPFRPQYFLEPSDLVVGFCGCTNNSARTFFSVCGATITLAGSGCSAGHVRTGPALLQPEIAATQISDSPISLVLCICFVLLVLLSDGAEHLGLRQLLCSRLLRCLELCGTILCDLVRYPTGIAVVV